MNHFKVRFSMVRADALDKSCKAFVKPQVVPPLHRHQVAKPLQYSNRTHCSMRYDSTTANSTVQCCYAQ